MTSEKDREEARELCEDMSSISASGIFDPTVEKFVLVAADKIAHIRAEAVKAERELFVKLFNAAIDVAKNGTFATVDSLRFYNFDPFCNRMAKSIKDILSNDQEANRG